AARESRRGGGGPRHRGHRPRPPAACRRIGRGTRSGVPCPPMKVGIPKEIYPHERRVAATPDTVEKIVKLGLEVVVEAGAGEASAFTDAAYAEAGAGIVPNATSLYAEADIVLKVRRPIAR